MIAALILALGLLSAAAPLPQGAVTAPQLTDAEIEQFLLNARQVRSRSTRKGVTASERATLSDGVLTHDAHIQRIDEHKSLFNTGRGVELNFRDSWMYNVAAYKIDRLLGLNLVPVSVARRSYRDFAAYTWWVDDVLMDEGERYKKKLGAPDVEAWNRQMQLVRLFDQLISNTDRNLGNLLITNDWRLWAIDHTRAFRLNREPRSLLNVTACDRQVLERLKQLTHDTIAREVGNMLTEPEIDAVLSRRDAIVVRIESLGPSALFDRSKSTM